MAEDGDFAEVLRWMEKQIPGADVRVSHPSGEDGVLLRPRLAGMPLGSLFVTEEALDDFSAEEIIEALVSQGASGRLKDGRRVRLRFGQDGKLSEES